LLGADISVDYSKDGMLESVAQQIVQYLETVEIKLNSCLTWKDRIGLLSQVESHRVK